ncbi:MAG TPA: SPOR domain-containing protein [Vicinamibacterales bacterium]
MSDDGSQETQLRGKQLVFLGMSVTVVAVVIFLCGVMVGRGVPTARQASAVAIEADPATDTAVEAVEPDSIPTPTPSGAPPAPLEYPVIVSDEPGSDSLVKTAEAPRQPFAAETAAAASKPARQEPPAPTRTTPKPSAPATVASARPPTPKATATTTASAASVDRGGFLVQVAAYQREGDATTVSERLKRKGYPAFVTTATTAAGTWFRVRVGSFDTRAEAQNMATRLKRDEQLEPWVTR